MRYGSTGMETYFIESMDSHNHESRRTGINAEFEGLSFVPERRVTWSSFGRAIRHGIARNR